MSKRKGNEPASKRRFVSSAELDFCKKKPICKNTKRSQVWALNVFQEWIKCRNESIREQDSDVMPQYSEEDLVGEDVANVCTILCKFVAECRQKNGKPYCPKTLLQLLNNIQSHVLRRNPNPCRFMDSKDPKYKSFHNVLNNVSKKLLSEGVGAVKKQAKIVAQSEEDTLWEKGVVGTHSPAALSNAVFIYCGIYLCLRGGDEHRDLKLSQFEFKQVPGQNL